VANGDKKSVYYRRALRNLKLGEFEEICLGFAEGGTEGSGSGDDLSESLASGMTEAIQLGVQNERHFEEVSIFREGFGPDRISDIIARIMLQDLATYTKAVCDRHGIPTHRFAFQRATYNSAQDVQSWIPAEFELPFNPYNQLGVVLVPRRYLRADPTVNPEGFWQHSFDQHNEDLRNYFGDEIKRRANRETILELARRRPEYLREYLAAAERKDPEPYDFRRDPGFVVRWQSIAADYVNARNLRFDIADERGFLTAIPRGAVKTAHLWALENRTPVGGHFRTARLKGLR
jgi:hypothetical protein